MKIVFMGTPEAAVPTLLRLLDDGHEVVAVYTQPDRPSGRGNKITMSPVKLAALSNDLPVFQPEKIRSQETLDTMRSHQADAAVVVAYGRILPPAVLEIFPKGAINVHFSLLPKYRGAAPVNWAIVNEEKETGVTTMLMDEGLDTGAILLTSRTEIGEDETAVELMTRLSQDGAELLSQTLATFDNITPRSQDDDTATYAPLLKKEFGNIDWSEPANAISGKVRGFQPFPTTFTAFRGKKLTIWSAKAAEPQDGNIPEAAPIGTIATVGKDSLDVVCGSGTVLRIFEVQTEGRKRVSSRDLINSAKPVVGEMLGDQAS